MRPCWKDYVVKVGIAGSMGYSVVELLRLPAATCASGTWICPTAWLPDGKGSTST